MRLPDIKNILLPKSREALRALIGERRYRNIVEGVNEHSVWAVVLWKEGVVPDGMGAEDQLAGTELGKACTAASREINGRIYTVYAFRRPQEPRVVLDAFMSACRNAKEDPNIDRVLGYAEFREIREASKNGDGNRPRT